MHDALSSNLLTVGEHHYVFVTNRRSLMPTFARGSMGNGVQSSDLFRANSISPGSLNERALSLSNTTVATFR